MPVRGSDPDRLLIAKITGAAMRHARWEPLPEAEHAAAVAAVRELAAGRADLLAEAAGVMEGFAEGGLNELRDRQAARLCRDAGADLETVPGWVEEGRRRRAAANLPPMSGGLRGA